MDIKLGQKISLIVIVGLVIWWLGACNVQEAPEGRHTSAQQTQVQPKPIACPQIEEKSLRSLEFGRLSAKDMRQWLAQSSLFEGAKISTSSTPGGFKDFLTWEDGETQYFAGFRQDTLVRIWVNWPNDRNILPSGEAVVTCLGNPDLYQAVRTVNPGGPYIKVGLWYLKKGIVVESNTDMFRYDEQLPIIDENVLMGSMTIVAPDTPLCHNK